MPPPFPVVELPLKVQLVIVSVPLLLTPPPLPVTEPPVIVSPERDAVTLASTWNTRLVPPPLTITPAGVPELVIVWVPPVLLS